MRKKQDQFPPVGQGCKPVFMTVGMYHKRNFCYCQAHSHLELNRCEGCGEFFHTDRKNAKTCSDKCRKRISRKKRADGNKQRRVLVINTKAGRVEQEVLW